MSPRCIHRSDLVRCLALAAVLLAARCVWAQDGKPAASSVDLLVQSSACTGSDSWILFNRGDGTFHAERGGGVGSVAVGDFDGNGTIDIGDESGLYLNFGDAFFLYINFLSEILACNFNEDNAVAFADMNGDQLTDLLYACGKRLYIFYGTGDERYIERGPAFDTTTRYDPCESPMILEVGDINEDAFPDVLAGPAQFGPLFFLNNGDGTFSQGMFPSGYGKITDFDGDGHLDFVTMHDDKLLVHKGDGQGEFSEVSYDLRSFGWGLGGLAQSDFNNDGRLDVAFIHVGDASRGDPAYILVLFGQPDGSFGSPSKVVLPLRFDETWVVPLDMVAGDFNGDGFPDLALACVVPNVRGHTTPGAVCVYYGHGDGTFSEPSFFDGPPYANRIFVLGDIDRRFIRGDANQDGQVDIADAIAILWALFAGGKVTCGKAFDVDDDSHVTLTDAIALLQYLFRGGAPPQPPYPAAGIDETDYYDALGCTPEAWEALKGHR